MTTKTRDAEHVIDDLRAALHSLNSVMADGADMVSPSAAMSGPIAHDRYLLGQLARAILEDLLNSTVRPLDVVLRQYATEYDRAVWAERQGTWI